MPMVITDGLSSRGWWSATGSLTSGRHTHLLSHIAAGAGRARQGCQRANPTGGKSTTSQSTGTLDATGCRPHVLTEIQQVRALLGLEPPQGQLQHVGAAARAVIGGDEVAADPQRVEDHAAGLDVVLVGAEGTEQRAQVIHAPVVDASEALGDRLLAPGPVADCEVDPQRLVAGGGERGQSPQLGPGVPTLAVDALDHLIDAHPLPRVEYLLEQRAPVVEVPVEAAPGDAERPRQQLDPDGVRAAGGKRPQPLFDPAAAWRACRGGHRLSVSRPARSLTAPQMMASLHPYITVWFESTMRIPNTTHTSRPGGSTRSPATSGSRTCGRCRRRAARTTSLGRCRGLRGGDRVIHGWLRPDFLHRIARIAEDSA